MATQQWQYSEDGGTTWSSCCGDVPAGFPGRLYRLKPEPPAPEPGPCCPTCGERGTPYPNDGFLKSGPNYWWCDGCMSGWNQTRRVPCQECGQHSKDYKQLRAACDWHEKRLGMMQEVQKRMRDPERTMVCDILANGCLLAEPNGGRYAIKESHGALADEQRKAFEQALDKMQTSRNEWRARAATAEQACQGKADLRKQRDQWKASAGELLARAEKVEKERDQWRDDARMYARNADHWYQLWKKADKTAADEMPAEAEKDRDALRARLAGVAKMLREWLATAEREPGLRTILAKAEGREAGQ